MAGYGCKHLSDDAVVKIKGFLAETSVVFYRKSFFMAARSFVELVEQGKVAGKSMEELLHQLVSENTEKICVEDTNSGAGVFDQILGNEVFMTERSIEVNLLEGTDINDSGTDSAMCSNLTAVCYCCNNYRNYDCCVTGMSALSETSADEC